MAAIITWLISFEKIWLRVVSAMTGNPPLGWQNLHRTIAHKRFHRIKGGGVVPPPSQTNNFDRVDEIQRFLWILLSVTLGEGRGRGRGRGRGGEGRGRGRGEGEERRGHSTFAFYSVKCVMTNFSLRHNGLCFSFLVVLYSMYSLYAIITMVLLKEIVMCNNNLRLKSSLTRSTDH